MSQLASEPMGRWAILKPGNKPIKKPADKPINK